MKTVHANTVTILLNIFVKDFIFFYSCLLVSPKSKDLKQLGNLPQFLPLKKKFHNKEWF